MTAKMIGGGGEGEGGDGSSSCLGRWQEPYHMLFQLAHTAMLLSFLAPNNKYGLLFLHAMLIAGFLLLCSWAWAIFCSPDIFSWNFSFLLINVIQVLFIFYRLRPIPLSSELEDIFHEFFQPLKVSRSLYKKLVTDEGCRICSLQQGEAYATEDVTRTDGLSLMITGTAHVSCNGHFLHLVQQKQFLDSSEFESTLHGDDTFKVSVVAVTPCRYLRWNRRQLEALFSKEQHLMTVMLHIIGRDITNKLYQFTGKTKKSRIDVRLPNFVNSSSTEEDASAAHSSSGAKAAEGNGHGHGATAAAAAAAGHGRLVLSTTTTAGLHSHSNDTFNNHKRKK